MSEIKPLYQKLKPEVKERLYSQSKDYKLTVNRLIEKLKTTCFYTDLRITEVHALQTFSDTHATEVYEFKWGEHLFDDLYDN